MPKTNFPNRIKIAVLNIMQAFGSAASQMARNAKLRVSEINLESRRHEILTEFSLQAYEMWHSGVKLPKELSDMFTELNDLDNKLSVLRAQKFVKVENEEPSSEGSDAKASCESKEETTSEDTPSAPLDTEDSAEAPSIEQEADAKKEAATPSPEKPKKDRPAIKRTAKSAKDKPQA